MNNYISVEEFIKLNNISFNDFYDNYFKGLYKGYTIEENGNIFISAYLLGEDIKPPKAEETEEPKANDNIINNTADNTAELKAEIERLRKELAEKDKQIIECLNKFAELTEKALQITSQGQYIQALDKAPETANKDEIPQTTDIIIQPQKQNIFKRIIKKIGSR